MKKQNIITSLFFITLACNVHAIEKYVTDNVDVYLRRGPGAQYALSNSAKAGEKVTELEKSSDGKYTRIQVSNGTTAWIESNKLNENPSYKELYFLLEAQLADYKNKANNVDQHHQNTVDDYVQKLQTAEKSIENLQNKNNELEKQIDEQRKQIDAMQNNQSIKLSQEDSKPENTNSNWLFNGGLIAGGGLILGLVLPSIIPKRRK